MNSSDALSRRLGPASATLLGLGAMLGTGIFVSLALAADAAGPAIVWAIVLAAALAACNGMSSAQLAATYPVSGGTYEYAHRLLHPAAGFAAGWLFLAAKSASAATAAIGLGGYIGAGLGLDPLWHRPIALGAAAVLGIIVYGGLRRGTIVHHAMVAVTLLALLAFAWRGLSSPAPVAEPDRAMADFGLGLFPGAAIMFVAFTGYGRIATLGEEARRPRRTIPLAILTAIAITTAVYVLVALAAVPRFDGDQTHPLLAVAQRAGWPNVAVLLSVGAVTAMAGVLLNLLLGLSRVLLAMGRRGEAPAIFARVDAARSSPKPAVAAVSLVVLCIAALGTVKAAWSFSAVTVLIYYGLTNLAALRLPPEARLYPRVIPMLGLVGCLGLAVFIEPVYWAAAAGVLAAGFGLRTLLNRGPKQA